MLGGIFLANIIGIDIGGTKCAVILGEVSGEASILDNQGSEAGDGVKILDKIKFPTEIQKGPEYMIDLLVDSVDKILIKNGKKPALIDGIGISCGGPLDSKKGVIMSPPNLPGWDDIHIVEAFEKRCGIKTKLQNDANACALAEWKFGAGKGYNNMVFLTFGTGLGAGLILNGRLYAGTNDMAGEVGHIRLEAGGPVGYGKAGSFEGFCSGGGIAQLAKTMVLEKLQMGEAVSFCGSMDELDELDARIVADAARAGDELAKEIYKTSGYYLGKGLSVIIDILNPEAIVIGSIFARARDLLWPSAKEIIEKESLYFSRSVCRVLPAGLGEKIGDYGALAVSICE